MFRVTMPLLVFAVGLWLMTGTRAEASASERRIAQPVKQSINARQATQQAEEQWRLEKEKLVARYEQLQQKEKQLTERKKALKEQAAASRIRISAKSKQLADIEDISAQIPPFIDELFHALKSQMVDAPPFLETERQGRISRLETVLADPDVVLSEKYRKLMEALLVEAEYGFTMEAYQETITIDGQPILADIFRLGRISLFYQRLDRRECGFFNLADNAWEPLDPKHNPAIQMAIDIAAKRRPIELLTLPIGRMVPK